VPSPGTKYKPSKNVFAVTSIALSLAPFGTKLLELPAQSPIGSPGTLHSVALLDVQFKDHFSFFLGLSATARSVEDEFRNGEKKCKSKP